MGDQDDPRTSPPHRLAHLGISSTPRHAVPSTRSARRGACESPFRRRSNRVHSQRPRPPSADRCHPIGPVPPSRFRNASTASSTCWIASVLQLAAGQGSPWFERRFHMLASQHESRPSSPGALTPESHPPARLVDRVTLESKPISTSPHLGVRTTPRRGPKAVTPVVAYLSTTGNGRRGRTRLG